MDPSRRAFFRGKSAPPVNPVARIAPSCLALQGVDCRVCGDACDPRAIRFPPRLGGVAQPVLNEDACTGCGDCIGVCPTQSLSLAGR